MATLMCASAHRATLRTVTTTPAQRLGKAIELRRGDLRVSQQQLAEKLKVGMSTVRRLEQAARRNDMNHGRPHAKTLASIDDALGWEPGSAAACWDDGLPPRPAGTASPVLVLDDPPANVRTLFALITDLPSEEQDVAVRTALAVIRSLGH